MTNKNVEQFISNSNAMGWRLDADEISELEEAADQLKRSFQGAGFKRSNEC